LFAILGQLVRCQFTYCHALSLQHIPAMPSGRSSAPYTTGMADAIPLPLDIYAVRKNGTEK